MGRVQAAVVKAGGFDWQNFRTVRTPPPATGAGAGAGVSAAGSCAAFLRAACQSNSTVQHNATQFTISTKKDNTTGRADGTLTNFPMDLAVFLAARGDYAWLGYGWLGCGCGWDGDGKMPCDVYTRPAQFSVDYGRPTELCHEGTGTGGRGVFTREWTKATVVVDCNVYSSEIKMKG